MPTIYFASKTKHAYLWRQLRCQGLNVNSTWIDEAGEGETENWSNLWLRCIKEASEADCLIMYREEGEVLKGALVEVGAALAAGKPVLVVGDLDHYSFRNHPSVSCFEDLPSAIEYALSRVVKP